MGKSMLIPKLRFSNYSDEWNSYELWELLTLFSFKFHPKKELDEFKNIKTISYEDIYNKLFTIVSLEDHEHFSFIKNNIDLTNCSNDHYLKDGDLIIADISYNREYVLKAIEVKDINDVRFLAGPRTLFARDKKDVTVFGFKAYLFSTPNIKNKLEKMANELPVGLVNRKFILKLKVNIPSKKEQQDIVNFLISIDEKILLLEKKYESYLNLKKYLIEQLFTQNLRFKDKNGKCFEDWKKIHLKDTDIEILNKDHRDNFPKQKDFLNKGIPFIRTVNIQNSKLTFKDMRYVSESLHDTSFQIHLKKKDILITTRGDIGLIAYVTDEFENSHIDSKISLLRVNDKNIDYKFLYYLFTSNYLQKQLFKYQTGYNIKRLDKHDLKNLLLLIPPHREQMMIVHFLDKINNKIELNQSKLSKIKLFKRGLLKKMFV